MKGEMVYLVYLVRGKHKHSLRDEATVVSVHCSLQGACLAIEEISGRDDFIKGIDDVYYDVEILKE